MEVQALEERMGVETEKQSYELLDIMILSSYSVSNTRQEQHKRDLIPGFRRFRFIMVGKVWRDWFSP